MIKHILLSFIFFITTVTNSGFCDSVYIENSFEDAVLLSQDTGQPVLVVFSADWCKYCKIMKKDIEQNLSDFDSYIICYIDNEKREDLVKKYRVKTIPDYFILKKNIEIKRKVGYSNYPTLTRWLNH
jgi:thioredoxin-related protein